VRRPWTLLSLASLLLLAPAGARAGALLAKSVEESARTSDAVVRGTVVSTASRWAGGHIVTDVEIAVTSAWKGQPGRQVTVTIPGGVVGDLGQHVDAAPTFSVGEEVVVFVQRAPNGKTNRVNGLAQGKYRVEDGLARPDTNGVELHAQAIGAGEKLVQPMAVDELERRVRGAK
jgi:hypothetical protein